jgi:hypothetical protein
MKVKFSQEPDKVVKRRRKCGGKQNDFYPIEAAGSDWANFRPLCNRLQWAVFLKTSEIAQCSGNFFSMEKVVYLHIDFDTKKG